MTLSEGEKIADIIELGGHGKDGAVFDRFKLEVGDAEGRFEVIDFPKGADVVVGISDGGKGDGGEGKFGFKVSRSVRIDPDFFFTIDAGRESERGEEGKNEEEEKSQH